MPQRPIPIYWRERVKAILAQMEQENRRLSDTRVYDILKAEAERLWDDPDSKKRVLAKEVPSKRTISRIRTEDFAQMKDAERALYRSFFWPESMERGDLPWEASASALELLGHPELWDVGGKRPPIRFVKWFCRVTQIASGSSLEGRIIAASILSSNEVSSGSGGSVRGVEWWLAYRPWDGEDHWKRYAEATSRVKDRIPPLVAQLPASEENLENVPGMRAWIESLLGSPPRYDAILQWAMLPENVTKRTIRIRKSKENNG